MRNPKMTTSPASTLQAFEIRRRAFGRYETVETFLGSHLGAISRAMELEYAKRDGEYLVRRPGEANWIPGAAVQSGLDFL
jgi:hypothetical protein